MGDTFVISGLTQKRAEIFGLIIDLEARMRQARADLAHVDATILLFDPDANPAGIKPKRSSDRSGWFENGEKSRLVRDALRTTGQPVAADDVVRHVMEEKGLDPADKKVRQKLVQSFLGVLHRMHDHKEVAKIGHGLGARWTLPGPTE